MIKNIKEKRSSGWEIVLPKDFTKWSSDFVYSLVDIAITDESIKITKNKSNNPGWWDGYVCEFVIDWVRISAQVRAAGIAAYSVCVSNNKKTNGKEFDIYNENFITMITSKQGEEIYSKLDRIYNQRINNVKQIQK